ncbi:LamG-like jellyroll fold domain-containing protein [Peribacillus frigoritolerans]|uniref:LamG-like jellyroll fold domain-containing protein n=1 Tax=Peribacillus frigoritolerans TaxID=450367 RepID=UPI002E23081D|nr:UDP-N-acetylglucosamine 2-epimerase [Peribacillus frigoritolerans]MED3849562.1 UDP-N-acetylglucosamine 2-epimerase [Peribacillus frigoritolerans]
MMIGERIFTFKGKEQIIIAPLLKDLKNTLTYEFWIKPSASHQIDCEAVRGSSGIRGQRYVVFPGNSRLVNEAGIGISVGYNGISVYEHSVNHLPATLVHRVSIFNWTHIAVVYKNKTPYLYINGEFIKKGLASAKETLYASAVFGGAGYGYFKGDLRELKIWSYARTQTQIKLGMNKVLTGNETGLYIYNELRNNLINGTRSKESILNKYPVFIKENMDLLYRWGIVNQNPGLDLQDINHINSSVNVLETCTFQNEWYLSDVLLMFGCYRKDYELLLFPVANRLAEKDLSVNVLIHDKSSPNLSMLSKKVNVLYYDQLSRGYNTHNEAKKYFSSKMLTDIDKFGHEMRLNPSQVKRLKFFYQQYAFDKLFTTNLLEKLRPKCIYGIHFILNPGCIHAIKATKFPIFCSLIQHGLISVESTETHDFKGADQVFLWGDFFESLLMKKVNAPYIKVIGNPKIEQIKLDLKANSDWLSNEKLTKKNAPLKILYILNASPNQKYSGQNLSLFLKSITQIKNIEIIYKLHPNTSLDDCKRYIEQGLIKQSQIMRDVNIYDLIKNADIIVGDFSTSMFESAALNKPVIQIYQSNYPEEFLKFAYATTSKELTTTINRLKRDQKYLNDLLEDQQKNLLNLFHDIDGSSERIAAYIDTLIRSDKE